MSLAERTQQEIRDVLKAKFAKDPVLCANKLFSEWFPRPMPWFHRGMLAIALRRADFLLNFGEEEWASGKSRWTKKHLAKIVRNFRYKINPKDKNSPTAPVFIVKYAEDGRTPISIDMVLGQHVCEIVPRGFSKTTLCNFTNIYRTLYQLTKFTVYISESAPHAEAQLATIQRELSANEELIAIYGNLKPSRSDDESWGAKQFETLTGVKFVARGSGAQIRGLNKFGDRPDTIVIDDGEDREEVKNEVLRKEKLSWMMADVMKALPRNRPGYVWMLGTILHPECLLISMSTDRRFTTIHFGALVPTGRMLEPVAFEENGDPIPNPEKEALWDDENAGMSIAQIEQEREDFAAQGKLNEFAMETLSEIGSDEGKKFKDEYFRYETCKPSDFVARSIHVDPAISGKPGADYCSIAVVGQRENGRKHVCSWWGKQGATMTETINMYFDMKMDWECTHHSSESTAYQAALAQSIREAMFRKAKIHGTKAYFQIIDVYPKTRKVERVEGIIEPILKAGYLTFQQVWPPLLAMFSSWPLGKLDGPDAIAGAIANLEPYAALSYGDSDALAKEIGDDIEYDAPCAIGSGEVP